MKERNGGEEEKSILSVLKIQARVMLELGLTPFSPAVKKFTPTHWYVFYSVIKERDEWLIQNIAELLGIRIGKEGFVPFGYVVNAEVMKEIEKLREIERVREEKPEYEELSAEELRFILDEIDKELKKAEDKNEKMEW